MTDVADVRGADEELEVGAVPFRALYDHWERTRWSLRDLDYAADRASFAALDPAGQERMRWLFTHRFDGEATVARLMTPFVEHAPDLDVRLLMSTQLVDEVRHVKAIVRIYEEVLGIPGGYAGAQAAADARRDPVTGGLYEELGAHIERLAADPTPDNYLRAVTAYHVIGEGIVARVSTQLSGPAFESWGDFPGILEGQRLVSRDESRHIGIGVTYVRREVARDRARALGLVGEVFARAAGVFEASVQAATGAVGDAVAEHYGVTAEAYLAAARRLIAVRLRSIGAGEPAAAAAGGAERAAASRP